MMQPSHRAKPHAAVAFSPPGTLRAGERLVAYKSRGVSQAHFCKTARLFARDACSEIRYGKHFPAQIQRFFADRRWS